MKKQLFYIISGILMLTTTAQAQTVLNSQVVVNEVKVKKENQELKISFNLDLTNVKIKSNNFYMLTPILQANEIFKELPSVEILGHRRNIYNMRNEEQLVPSNNLEAIVRKNKTKQTVDYSISIPYKEWMNNATLKISEKDCECLNTVLATMSKDIKKLDIISTIYPRFAWTISVAEEIKIRHEVRTARLSFPVNKVRTYPNYLNNPEELNKTKTTIDLLRSDKNLVVTGITIKGYTSPEGSYAVNTRLAKGRAESFKQYIKQQYSFPDNIFTVGYGPENWAGLKKLVEASNMEYRNEILGIIDRDINPDVKNTLLMKVDRGVPYQYMLKIFYPMLRQIDYKIHYNIRSFAIEEAKIILDEAPEQLNLYEVYSIAQTYEVNSTEFDDIIRLSLTLFPESPETNLNAANLAIIQKDYDAAGEYLIKAGNTPESIHSKGVLEMMKKNYATAKELLEAAKMLGVDEATYNLTELEKVYSM